MKSGRTRLDLAISGGRALSRGLDQPRDQAAGNRAPASRHMRVTIPSAEPTERSCPKIRATHLLRAVGSCFSDGASATKTMTRKSIPIVAQLSSAPLSGEHMCCGRLR